MNKLAAACCYYGKLPDYFNLWLASAGNNSFIDFFLFTDRKTVKNVSAAPKNVKIVILPFDELKKRIQSLYKFKIVLPKPYKLCDYKFAYGEIFRRELAQYDFFGWYDIDVIQGDMKKFITDEALKCDIIGELGHFTLMRSSLYRFYRKSALSTNLATPYKRVFRLKASCYFDELYGLNRMSGALKKYSLLNCVADVVPDRRNFYVFHRENEGKFIIRYDGKRVIKIFDDGREEEAAYVHLQKRKPAIAEGVTPSGYYITPDGFSLSPEYGEGDCENYKEIADKLEKEYKKAEGINGRAAVRKRIKNRLNRLFRHKK